MKFHAAALSTSTAILAVFCTPAWAVDADDFASKFFAMWDSSGIGTEYSVTAVGDDGVRISGLTVTASDLETPMEVPLSMNVFGITEDGNGGYRAESAQIEGFSFTEDDISLSVGEITLSGIDVPATASYETINDVPNIEVISVGEITVDFEGQRVATLSGLEGTSMLDRQTSIATVQYGLTRFEADLSGVDDEEAVTALAALGLLSISGSSQTEATINYETGLLDITENRFTIDDVGQLDMYGAFTGYDLELASSMIRTQQQVAKLPADAKDAAMMGMGVQLISKVGLAHFTIRFDDDSISEKLIDLFAVQQGVDRATLGVMASAMIPAAMAEFNVPQLAKSVSKAVSDFIADPKSIEIGARPENPVTPIELMPFVESPEIIVDMLGVTVTANQ